MQFDHDHASRFMSIGQNKAYQIYINHIFTASLTPNPHPTPPESIYLFLSMFR